MADDLSIPSPGIRSTSTSTTMRSGRYGAQQRAAKPGMDPDVRRMALFAGGIGGLLAVLIGISALTGRHSGEVPVIAADGRPIRVKPADPGGMKINQAENDVFSGGSDTRNARLGPAAETPDTTALRTAAADSDPAAETPAPAPSATLPASTAQPVAKAPSTPASSASSAQTVAKAPPAPAPAATPLASAQPTAKAPSTLAPSTSAAGAQNTVKAASVPAPAPRPVPAPAAALAPATATPPGHGPGVQLAALTTEQAAHIEWQALVKRMPDLLAGHQPIFSRTERDGRTYWRVRTSGFADVAQARGFCEKVRTKGGGCSVTEF
ncbi:MAG: SPOR domain-containing protein [Rhodopila sp.]